MNRSKYRVYNTKRGCYEDVFYYAICCSGTLHEFKRGLKSLNMEIRIIEWCTGQKDIKGNLVYAGDIIEGGFFHNIKLAGVIVWAVDQWRVRRTELDHIVNWKGCEIIGTIHENPLLLN